MKLVNKIFDERGKFQVRKYVKWGVILDSLTTTFVHMMI